MTELAKRLVDLVDVLLDRAPPVRDNVALISYCANLRTALELLVSVMELERIDVVHDMLKERLRRQEVAAEGVQETKVRKKTAVWNNHAGVPVQCSPGTVVSLRKLGKDVIFECLEKHNWNKAKTARELGVKGPALSQYVKRHWPEKMGAWPEQLRRANLNKKVVPLLKESGK